MLREKKGKFFKKMKKWGEHKKKMFLETYPWKNCMDSKCYIDVNNRNQLWIT